MRRASLPALVAALSACAPSQAPQVRTASITTAAAVAESEPARAWTIVWQDEFDAPDGSTPDPAKWTLRTGGGGWGNDELQVYTDRPDNAFLRGGALHLVARREADGTITSARMDTQGKFDFTHGRVEMRARLPVGAGMWPAFWMLGSEFGKPDAWPACGEIDVMELIGREPTRVHATLHSEGDPSDEGVSAVHEREGGFADGFHVYAADWSPGVVRFSFDGEVYATRTDADLGGRPWAFDHAFFLLLNLAVGGSWPGPPDETTPWPAELVVDWVRVSKQTAAIPPSGR